MVKLIRNTPRSEVKWSKLLASYMWNNVYYLRRTKFAVYQLANLFSSPAVSLGIAVLADYRSQHSDVLREYPGSQVQDSDIIGVFAFNIFAGFYGQTIFTTLLFYDLWWPERIESDLMKLIWKGLAIIACIFELAACLAITIVVATHKAVITGVSVAERAQIDASWKKNPVVYKHNARSVASAVLCWISWIFVVWSTIVLFKAYAHNDVFGPFNDNRKNKPSVEVENDSR